MGCHAFPSFRVTWLRKNLIPEDLITFCLGHAGKTVTETDSKLEDDAEFRKQVVQKVGSASNSRPKQPLSHRMDRTSKLERLKNSL